MTAENNRRKDDAANPLRAEQALSNLVDAVIDAVVRADADQARRFLDSQTAIAEPLAAAGVRS